MLSTGIIFYRIFEYTFADRAQTNLSSCEYNKIETTIADCKSTHLEAKYGEKIIFFPDLWEFVVLTLCHFIVSQSHSEFFEKVNNNFIPYRRSRKKCSQTPGTRQYLIIHQTVHIKQTKLREKERNRKKILIAASGTHYFKHLNVCLASSKFGNVQDEIVCVGITTCMLKICSVLKWKNKQNEKWNENMKL